MDFRKKYQEFFAGYDLVGEEDSGGPLIDYINELLIPSKLGMDLPYFFHAGETGNYPYINDIEAGRWMFAPAKHTHIPVTHTQWKIHLCVHSYMHMYRHTLAQTHTHRNKIHIYSYIYIYIYKSARILNSDMTTGVPEYCRREENGLGTWDVAVFYKFIITSFRLVHEACFRFLLVCWAVGVFIYYRRILIW